MLSEQEINNPALPSMPEVYRSIRIPVKAAWLKRFLAFAGPALDGLCAG